jgi:HAD superfamily hydrolase (TIGR01509 family)
MPLRLITIDLDDTLWPSRPPLEAAERALYRWLQVCAVRLTERHDMASLREHRLALREARPDLAHDITGLRRVSLEQLLSEAGYPETLAQRAMEVFLEHRNRVSPYADASPVLRVLAERFRLISVTNGNADVERTRLSGHFHHALRAEQVGAAKPDPALFTAALAVAHAMPREALHLGDDPLLDVEAARRVGMHAVWMNRNATTWPAQLAPPEAEVADMYAFSHWLDDTQA